MANTTDDDQPTSSENQQQSTQHDSAASELAVRAAEPQNFTARGLVLGCLIGVLIVFSNTYFGLQTGWISGMNMPSALIGFAFFRSIDRFLKTKFSPVENVLIQTVAGSVGTMPLGCGFVGVIPALEFLMKRGEQGEEYTFFFHGVDDGGGRTGGINIGLPKLILWATGICLFGVVFAVPLRKEVIIREKLKFPSGTATALMIGVLHGQERGAQVVKQEEQPPSRKARTSENEVERQGLMSEHDLRSASDSAEQTYKATSQQSEDDDWRKNIRNMSLAFFGSAVYTVTTYFMPFLRNIPIFGKPLARNWLWKLDPSPAYAGQGIIMGLATTSHMFFGALLGWGILSPLAKSKGWAPGPVADWETGSKGWIVWVSLAIMLADALVSLAWLVARPLFTLLTQLFAFIYRSSPTAQGYTPVLNHTPHSSRTSSKRRQPTDPSPSEPDADAPAKHLVSPRAFLISLAVSTTLYYVSVHLSFAHLLTIAHTTLALILALLLSLLGVRALGETDLNPVSGISKLTQLVFAALVPASGNPNAVPINLLAGAISESAAIQAGDLMQDLKTGHLLGAAPAAQFYGQVVGSVVGAVVSALVYKLYVHVYPVPGPQFQVPTAYVWVFTARLVTGQGLPPMGGHFAGVAGVVWGLLTVLRLMGRGRWWVNYVPGGIAVAVGMYNTPSFTLARAAGGLLSWWWLRRHREETGVVVLASGLILGEGLVSIVNLGLASGGVPHLADWE